MFVMSSKEYIQCDQAKECGDCQRKASIFLAAVNPENNFFSETERSWKMSHHLKVTYHENLTFPGFKCYNQVPSASINQGNVKKINFVLLSLFLQASEKTSVSDFAPLVTWQRDLIIILHLHLHLII